MAVINQKNDGEPVEYPDHWLSQFNAEFKPGEAPKMNEDIKRRWLEALRSGDYTQGTKWLKANTFAGSEDKFAFCCLGVLCEQAIACNVLDRVVGPTNEADRSWRYQTDYTAEQIAEEKKWIEEHGGVWDENNATTLVYHSYNTMPGHEVAEWSGLPETYMRALASANDSGASFALIADFIEKEF